jgi:serine/threonine protein kinase
MIPREGILIADRYRLERKVGGGRVSAVWRVRDEISSRPCAIKLLHRSMHKHPEALTRFSLEDRLARELTGAHFPERVGSGVWDGMRYIAWRWHEGESLRALFERNPKQDAPSVHSIVQETCQALSLVHAAGYAHGDLKPENILFADRGEAERSSRQIKLLGFGVASRLSRPSAAGFGVSRRRAGELVGTPLYSSPDLILGRVPNGGQADLWALAVIVYEALTGRPPFLGFDVGAVLQAILEKRAPRPSSVADNLPGSFDAWWAQALAQEFDTPSEFAGALARALAPALRTSHTQRSASLPDRAPLPLEALTPMPAVPPRGNASTTASGIGPTDIGLQRAANRSGKRASAAPALATTPSPVGSAAAAAPSAMHAAVASSAAAAPSAALASPVGSLAAASPATPPPAAAAPPAGMVSAAMPSAALPSAAMGPETTASSTLAAPARTAPAAAASLAAHLPSAVPAAALAPAAASLPAPSPTPTTSAAPAVPAASAVSAAPAAGPSLTTGVPPLATEAPRAAPPVNDTFVPFPSPLRDLGAEGARKTLVGITPPALQQSIASALGAKAAAPVAGAPPAAGNPRVMANERTIEGAPCKPIETADEHAVFDFGAFDASRRPANPTVPFPRPRPVPRTAALPNPSDETPDIGRASWHGTTTRTLRFVLTSPDHKPQRVAAILVCAVAALVIFAVGRSPLAGTAGIGQTTGALSAEPNPKSAPSAQQPGVDRGPELAKASGSDPNAGLGALDVSSGAAGARELDPPPEDELAPGLILLPATERVGADGSPSGARPDGVVEAGGAVKPRPAAPPSPAAKPPVKKIAPPPPPPSLPPAPARKNSTELDFGI